MKNIESPVKMEKELQKYIYRDNSASGKIIFECTAKNIIEADKLYKKKTGNNPEKQSYIGCSVKKINIDEKNQ